ncbi:MAG: hypothetical protein ABI680_08690 [Chthoniobacteraceae bacterium]
MFTKIFPAATAIRIAICSFALVAHTHALDFFWDNGSGTDSEWNTPINWDLDAVPGIDDAAVFNDGLPAAAISGDVPEVDEVRFQNASGTLDHTAGTLNVTGRFRMGVQTIAAGTYSLSGGQVNANAFSIGENFGSDSTVNLSGGTLNQRDVADLEDQNSWNRIGVDGGANGTINLSGGTISLYSRTFIGSGGTATVNQTGGVFQIREAELNIADTGSATYNLSGGLLQTLNVNQVTSVGQWDNANGELNVSATGEADFAGRLIIGAGQPDVPTSGTLNQTGGIVRLRRGLSVGNENAATGTYNLEAGMLQQEDVPTPNNDQDTSGWNHIGDRGTAMFNLSGGTVSFDDRTHLGSGATGNGTVTQTAGLFEVRRSLLLIGDTGTGVYNISGGTLQTLNGNNIHVGNWNGSNGQLNVSGTAEVISGGSMIIGQAENDTFTAMGVVNQTGGRVQVAGDILLANSSVNASGTYNLNGGLLDLTSGNINQGTGTAAFHFNNGRLQDLGNYNLGALDQIGGILAPGPLAATGTTTVNGNYSLNNNATLEISITDEFASDVLFVNGSLTLGGSLSIVDDPASLTLGSSYLIVNNDDIDPIVGFFAGQPQNSIFTDAAGNSFQINYLAGDGNDIELLVTIPEPAVGGLLLSIMGIFAMRRWRAV